MLAPKTSSQILVRLRSFTAGAFYAGLSADWRLRVVRNRSARIGRYREGPVLPLRPETFGPLRLVTFFRQTALLLPCAFLLGVLLFLLTHGRQDPGFGAYPFFEQWAGGALVASTPEGRFVEQSIVFFGPTYVLTLLFVLFVVMAENGVFGRRERPAPTAYRRAFALAYAGLFMIATGVLVFLGERVANRVAPGALVAPLLVAGAPYAAAAVALVPAAILAFPFAMLVRATPA